MNKPSTIFLISLMILFLTSCNRGKLIEGYYVTEEMKSQVPFQGYETLTFTDESSNTFVFTGVGWVTKYIEQTVCINCNDYDIFESNWINFSGDLYEIEILLHASIENYLSIRYTFNGDKLGCGFTSPLSEENLKEQETIFDSIIINNVSYYDVYRDTVIYNGTTPLVTPYPVFFYYSIEYGLIKIDFSDNSYWGIKNIDWE